MILKKNKLAQSNYHQWIKSKNLKRSTLQSLKLTSSNQSNRFNINQTVKKFL